MSSKIAGCLSGLGMAKFWNSVNIQNDKKIQNISGNGEKYIFPTFFKVILNTLQFKNQPIGFKVFEEVKGWISNGLIFFRVMFRWGGSTTIVATSSSLMDNAVCRKAPDSLYNIWKEQSALFV